MGPFNSFFGVSSGEAKDGWTSANNPAEQQAMADHMSEQLNTGEDPIPPEPPDWAEDLPSPQ